MPITLPAIDDRDFDSLVRDALARASVHTPEWTHTGPSDPGVTLVELFAFMAESLLYRANLIPERNRLKFLQLLGVKLLPAAPAHGLVQLRNESPGHISVTLAPGLQAFAGPLLFITDLGLDVPPVEGLAVFKRTVAAHDPALLDYYRQLYEATGRDLAGTDLAPVLYETVALDDLPVALDVGAEAVDGALWIALLAPKKASDAVRQQVRERLAACTLSIGLVPERADPSASLIPGASARPAPALGVWMPRTGDAASGAGGAGGAAAGGATGTATAGATASTATARYRRLDAVAPAGFPDRAGILQVTMPAADAIGTWSIDEPLEAGVGELPPLLTDDELDARVLTWLRIDGLGTAGVRLRWAGIHCATVTQRSRVERETLAPGDGDVNQQRQLGHGQVLAESVVLAVGGQRWTLTDELEAAPAEGKPGATVFALDAEAGLLRFGDGVRGARPPAGAAIAVAYDWSNGADGNVAAGAITLAPDLPAGIKLANPVACTGGTAAETAADGERRIPLVLRHRDRAVSADDFAEILRAAPGADLGRAEVLAAWHPELSPALPGDQPGVVTCMVIPRTDAAHPDNPLPDADFINALCNHLAPRRLVTCEVLLRGPVYSGVWISVGIEIVAGQSVATVRDRVRAALRDHLSPLPPAVTGAPAATLPGLENGWPLFRAVTALELAAVVARTTGVAGVAGLLLGDAGGSRRDSVPMQGLQLPFIAGLSVTLGDPVSLDDLVGRGSGTGSGDGGDRSGGNGSGTGGGTTAPRRLPVPKVPQEC